MTSGRTEHATVYVSDSAGDDSNDGLAPLPDGTHGPKKTIQAGINAAPTRGFVIVADGTYSGPGNRDINFSGKALTLKSENGAQTCIIDCPADSDPVDPPYAWYRGLVFNSGEHAPRSWTEFTITKGNVPDYGGGIYCNHASPTVRNCVIENNKGGLFGGGIYCKDSALILLNCSVRRNEAGRGGGIECTLDSRLTMMNCRLEENSSSVCGGIFVEISALDMTNCVLLANESAYPGGGAIGLADSTANIESCTLFLNRDFHLDESSGVIRFRGGSLNINNSILWGNTPARLWVDGGSVTVSYSNIQGGYAGEGNIAVDPQVSPDGHLRGNSPCVDVVASGPAVDMDGESRPVDIPAIGGDSPETHTYDMGADEFFDSNFDGIGDWEEINVYFTDPHDSDTDDDGLNDRDEVDVHGTDPNDADSDDDGRNDFEEAVDGTNPLYPDNSAKTYYVNDSTGSDANDGLAPIWDGTHGPKQTIQAGIDVAITDWDYAVEVASDTYSGPGNKDLDLGGKAITVRSGNGAATCIIDCEYSGRGFHFHTDETTASVVDGFTIINGDVSDYGGGIYCDSASPSVVNCTISGNTAALSGGGIDIREGSSPEITNCTLEGNLAANGGGVSCLRSDPGQAPCSPIIVSCTIRGNTATDEGGGIHVYDGSSPLITNCEIDGNTARTGGGIYCNHSILGERPTLDITGCTISGNTATDDGGGIFCEDCSPPVSDCIIRGNTASGQGGGIFWRYCGAPSLTRSSLAGNQADSGGGIYCYSSHPTIENCLIRTNTASGSGGESNSTTTALL